MKSGRFNEIYMHQIEEQAEIGIWSYDIQKNKVEASLTYFKIHELPIKEYLEVDEILNRFIPKDKARLQESIKKCINEQQEMNLELTLDTDGDQKKWLKTIGQPIVKDGKVIQILGICQNISNLKILSLEAKSSKARLDMALAAAKMGVWDWDYTHDRLYWDETMFEIFAIPKEKFTGDYRVLRDLMHEEDLKRAKKEITDCISSGKDYFSQFRIYLPNGKIKHIAARGRVDSSKDDAIWFTGINWDITQEVEQKEKIKSQELKIIASARLSSLGEMAGGIAHEINNPLAIIQGKADLIKHRIRSKAATEEFILKGLDKIEETCSRIVKIIKGLRSFSRDSEKDPLVPIPLEEILKDVLGLISEKIKHSGIELRIDASSSLTVCGRSAQLGQVFMNLLNNSFDAISHLSEKWIEIKAIKTDHKVEIRVTDSGAGIPLEIQDKILEPFFTTKELGKGTGLGLSIVRGIIEDHHGKIWIDNSVPHTTFVIELPLKQEGQE